MSETSHTLTVTLQNRDRILFEGQVTSITSTNEKGTFDILPEHSNFITILNQYILLRLPDKTQKRFACHEGVLWITKDIVRIIIDIVPDDKQKQLKQILHR